MLTARYGRCNLTTKAGAVCRGMWSPMICLVEKQCHTNLTPKDTSDINANSTTRRQRCPDPFGLSSKFHRLILRLTTPPLLEPEQQEIFFFRNFEKWRASGARQWYVVKDVCFHVRSEASCGQQHQRGMPDVLTAALSPVLTLILARRQKRCSSAVES